MSTTDRVARLLSEYVVTSTTDAPPPIDLFFVGCPWRGWSDKSSNPLFDTAAKIQTLVKALQDIMKVYKFTKGVHVNVTGTALETSTKKTLIPSAKLSSFVCDHGQERTFWHFW
jgi:hypothetical protein